MSEPVTIAVIGAVCTLIGALIPKIGDVINGRRQLANSEVVALRAEAAALRKELSDRDSGKQQFASKEATEIRAEAAELRRDLSARIDHQQGEIERLQDDVDEWKQRYYDLRDLYMQVAANYQAVVAILKANNLGHLIEQEVGAPADLFGDARRVRRRTDRTKEE